MIGYLLVVLIQVFPAIMLINRALCGLPRAEYFRDLLDIISPAVSAFIN
jgi:hypothetical protein